MKRLSVTLLLMFMVCNCIMAAAETIYEEPILFRGIEWGTSYHDIVETLGYEDKNTSAWDPTGLNEMFYNGESEHYGEVGFKIRTAIPEGGTVAGYDVEDVYLFFAYVPDDTGRLVTEKDPAKLCVAEYEFDFGSREENRAAAIEDLTNKLTLLYGDVDSRPTSSGRGNRAVWKGADGTLVSLFCYSGSYLNAGNYYRIQIRYSYEGMQDVLNAAKKALDLEFSFITDGL